MAKTFRGFRLSDEAIANLTKYKEEHKLKDDTEALEKTLLDLFNKPTPPKESTKEEDEEMDLPSCQWLGKIQGDNKNIYCDSKYRKGPRKLPIDACWSCWQRKQWSKNQQKTQTQSLRPKDGSDYGESESKLFCKLHNRTYSYRDFNPSDCPDCHYADCRSDVARLVREHFIKEKEVS
jgi:hypothetical protein